MNRYAIAAFALVSLMLAAACSSASAASRETTDAGEATNTGQSSEVSPDSGEQADTKLAPAPGRFAPTGLMNDDRSAQ